MKAIIFGVGGQDGRYLVSECQKKRIEVIPVRRLDDGKSDISKYEYVADIVKRFRPGYIFHLAANSTTAHDALFENHQAISTGTLNVLEAVKNFSPESKVFITGSGVQFKNEGQPIFDETQFEASSPYAVARIHSVYAARYYRALGIKAYVGYLFNHESPYRRMNCVSQKVVQAVKRIALGAQEKIEMGDIDVEKEWGFAGDITRAMLVLVQQDRLMEAVIGTGKAYSIKDWLKICFGLIKKDWQDYVVMKPGFKAEYLRLVSKPDKIMSLNWRPEIDIYQLAKLMVNGD